MNKKLAEAFLLHCKMISSWAIYIKLLRYEFKEFEKLKYFSDKDRKKIIKHYIKKLTLAKLYLKNSQRGLQNNFIGNVKNRERKPICYYTKEVDCRIFLNDPKTHDTSWENKKKMKLKIQKIAESLKEKKEQY